MYLYQRFLAHAYEIGPLYTNHISWGFPLRVCQCSALNSTFSGCLDVDMFNNK